MEGKTVASMNGGPSLTTAIFTNSLPTNRTIKIQYRLSSNSPETRKSKPVNSKPSVGIWRQAALKDIQHSSDFGTSLDRSGYILKVADLNVIMRSFATAKRWNELEQLFEWMRKNGKVNVASYSSYMKYMSEIKDVSRAINVYETIPNVALRNNTSICNSVLSCLVKNEMFDEAISLFHQMKVNGLQPDVVTYSTLLTGCLKGERRYTKALELLRELEDNGIVMDSVIYGTLIAVCAYYRKCEEAEIYFMRMNAEGHAPNVYHYSSLLNAYSTEGNYQKADILIQDMKSLGLVPNKVVMTTLLKVYVNGGLFDKSRSLLSELEALGYADDEMPYCQLMDGLSKSGNFVEAETVFNQMKKRRVRSDGYSHSIMISAFCRSGEFEKAKQLARDYESKYTRYGLIILNVMLCAYCLGGDMENVMRIMRKMDKLAINPDQKTFGILIKYFIKERLYLLAYRTLRDMHSKGYQLEEDVLSSFLLQLGRIGAHSEAFSVYNILRTNGQEIREPLREKLLHILLAGHLFEEAYAIIKDNDVRLMSPVAIDKFLAAFMQSGNIHLINEVLETVRVSGYLINQEILHQAISRYIANPEMKQALFELVQWISRCGLSIESSTRNLILKNSNLSQAQLAAIFPSKQPAVTRTSRGV